MQRDIVDQATLHKFKDTEKCQNLLEMFERFTEINKTKEGQESVEKLRKKVTHDIEHQINDLLALREHVASQVNISMDTIVIPPLDVKWVMISIQMLSQVLIN